MKLIQNIQFSSDISLLKVNHEGQRYFVDFYGDVSAGFPSPAEDFQQERISLDERFLAKPESTFLIKVGGLSMFPTYQLNDVLIIRSDYELNNGDDVVVSINNSEFTLKRWNEENKTFMALNPDYKDSVNVSDEDVVVCLGVVTALIRERKR